MRKGVGRYIIGSLVVCAIFLMCISLYSSPPTGRESYTSGKVEGEVSVQQSSEQAPIIEVQPSDSQSTSAQTEPAVTTTSAASNSKAETKKPRTTTTTTSSSPTQSGAYTSVNTTTAATAATTTTTTTTAATTTTTTTTAAPSTDYAAAMFQMINDHRAANGKAKLSRVTSGGLYEAAKKRLEEITVSYSHTRPNGSGSSSVYAEFGVYPGCCGENLARGGIDGVFEKWISSSGHNGNILNGSFTKSSLVTCYSNGKRYWVQLFIG